MASPYQNQQPKQPKSNAPRWRFKRDSESHKRVRDAMDEMRRLRGIRRKPSAPRRPFRVDSESRKRVRDAMDEMRRQRAARRMKRNMP